MKDWLMNDWMVFFFIVSVAILAGFKPALYILKRFSLRSLCQNSSGTGFSEYGIPGEVGRHYRRRYKKRKK